MRKCSLTILLQLFIVGSIFCQTEEWTLTNWETIGKPSRPTDYNPNQYTKVYLNAKDSTFIWRDRNGAGQRKYTGTFVRQKNGLYFLTSTYGTKIQAEIDTTGNVICNVSSYGERYKYYGKVEK